MAVAFNCSAGEGDALVSAGNTGALTGATPTRPHRASARCTHRLPCGGRSCCAMRCKHRMHRGNAAPVRVPRFAVCGEDNGVASRVSVLSATARRIPRATAPQKGAYACEKGDDEGPLVGNVEGSMVPLGACDVAVCDGFTGNVQLKTIEGVAKFMSKEIKGVFMASVGTKLGYLLCKKGMDDFREVFNQDKIGGAPFLGIAKPVIKAHGSSNEIAVMNAVRQAIAYTKSGMIDAVKENIQYMTVSE
ncbi:MAG: phosphate--acyl-ACP acyltransferase [Butyricicoccus sp.]